MSSKANSLAIALNAQRMAKRKSAVTPQAQTEDRPASIAEAIRKKQAAKKMAQGGLVEQDDLKEDYDSGNELAAQLEGDGEHQDIHEEEDQGKQDIASRIRRRLRG